MDRENPQAINDGNKNIDQERVQSTDDPYEFMRKFFSSSKYIQAYTDFYKGKQLAPDVTEEEKRKTFLEQDQCKFALIDFAKEELRFIYNPGKFPRGSAMAINTYIASVNDMIKMIRGGSSREEIENMDSLRTQYHQVVSEQLVKDGIVPSFKLGRALARLVLIDRNLDTFESAREPDIKRVQRKLGA